MSISTRQIKNKRDSDGSFTGRAGTVYDISIKYKTADGYKRYIKKGFTTKKDAQQHEAEMKVKLSKPSYYHQPGTHGKMTVKEYLDEWVDSHGKANLRPTTFAGYKSHIKNQVLPYIGHLRLNQISPAVIDELYQKLSDAGYAQNTIRYVHRVLGVSMEAARKYRYIEYNPVRDIITKLGKQDKTPDPYTIEQVRQFMSNIFGTKWELPVVLGGLYGLRISEILGLRWQNVDFDKMQFNVKEQLPFNLPAGTKLIDEMAPTKSSDRLLPITEDTLPYFKQQYELQEKQKEFSKAGGGEYYNNDLVIAKPDGSPYRRNTVSADFGHLLQSLDMPHIRFHDLRHTAATNMHQLTGDFFTVAEILGHTLKGVGMTLGISGSLEATTSQYVDVRLERKKAVLDAYHQAVHKTDKDEAKEKQGKVPKKKSKEAEI